MKILGAQFRLLIGAILLLPRLALAQADALPSWNDGAAKQAIVAFVARVTNQGSPDFVPLAERIATFDNDGTLWCEQPMYVQMAFMLDRVKKLAPKNPEWKNKQPFKAVLERDYKALAVQGEKVAVQLVAATHTGMSSEEFNRIAGDWIAKARHPKFQRAYTELVYQPMIELLAYLRANGFKTFIASGGGIDFMRVFAERVYGVPPEQVIGSSGKLNFELRDGKPVLMKMPSLNFIDDKTGKPVGIQMHIGRQPIAAFGNSDGDLQMLEWAKGNGGVRFALIVHHTDAEREWAYDRTSSIGRLDKALDVAQAVGWTIVDMKNDWKKIFSFGSK